MRTPLHLWIVGSVSALWNAFGCFDYVMSQTRNQAYLAALTDAQRAYFDHFPAWVQAAWAFGVWGALLGSMLLLTRSRWAVTAFAVSLAGLAVSTAWQYGVSAAPAEMRSAPMMIMNLVIWAVAIGLLLYALRMRQRGALR
ncbi:MAG TPA: hypothetical protein VGD66_09985 [Allosphingosinicella sp.]|jgi:hypothetical protein